MRAHGTINALVREGRLVYEAIYHPSGRHHARRLDPPSAPDVCGWPDETAAISALERAAARDGARLTIQAGSCPRGTRKRGDVLEVV